MNNLTINDLILIEKALRKNTPTERIKMVEDKCATADPSRMEQCYLFAEMAAEKLKKDKARKKLEEKKFQ